MRKISHLAALALGLAPCPLLGQATPEGVPIIVPSQSSIYNQNAVNLPSPPVTHGQDVVRGVSGASCQSAIASGGPYLDLGVIGSQDVFNRDTAAIYGRLVIPIGERPKRVDCTRLYELEITRLRMELDMMRMGARLVQPAAVSDVSISQTPVPSPRQAGSGGSAAATPAAADIEAYQYPVEK